MDPVVTPATEEDPASPKPIECVASIATEAMLDPIALVGAVVVVLVGPVVVEVAEPITDVEVDVGVTDGEVVELGTAFDVVTAVNLAE